LIRPDWDAFWKRVVEDHSAEDVAKDLGILPCEVDLAVSRVMRWFREEDQDGVPGRILLLRGLLELIQLKFEDRTFKAFWMVAAEGRSALAVADKLGMTVAAVHTAKCKVLKRLKEELEALELLSRNSR
jgi:DNA-directed RNA polymerase specialized sigma24 family protein